MKTSNAVLTGLAVAVVVAGLAWAIDVDVSGETKLPSVDVEMTEGELPAVDVETVDVDVTSGEKTVTIPYPEVDVQHEAGAQDGVAQEDDIEKMDERMEEMAEDAGDATAEGMRETADEMDDAADEVDDHTSY